MCVSREGLLASGVRRIMTLDSNQAGQHRPSGGGGLGEDSNWRLGACRKPKRNPKEGSCCFFKHTARPPLSLTLGLNIAEGSMICEAATVML